MMRALHTQSNWSVWWLDSVLKSINTFFAVSTAQHQRKVKVFCLNFFGNLILLFLYIFFSFAHRFQYLVKYRMHIFERQYAASIINDVYSNAQTYTHAHIHSHMCACACACSYAWAAQRLSERSALANGILMTIRFFMRS